VLKKDLNAENKFKCWGKEKKIDLNFDIDSSARPVSLRVIFVLSNFIHSYVRNFEIVLS